jgi:hypothetical protein
MLIANFRTTCLCEIQLTTWRSSQKNTLLDYLFWIFKTRTGQLKLYITVPKGCLQLCLHFHCLPKRNFALRVLKSDQSLPACLDNIAVLVKKWLLTINCSRDGVVGGRTTCVLIGSRLARHYTDPSSLTLHEIDVEITTVSPQGLN